MRALQVTALDGPEAVAVVDVPEPADATHPMTRQPGVVVDVHAAGVSFPDLLITQGRYQMRFEPPFLLGSEVAGTVRSAPEGSGFGAGDRVMAMTFAAGFADVAVAPPSLTWPIPDALDFAEGASVIMNYHTAWFCLAHRGALMAGETVLVHGAAGGVGTASLQVAKGLGARTIAVVSTEEKERVAREAGATTSSAPRASRTRSRSSPAGAASTSSSTRSAATASPTRCARSRAAGGCSSSASPPGRSPR
jgi:NADPH2:quinone reductase